MHNDNMSTKKTFSEHEAANYLQVSVHTLRQRRFRSMPPHYVKFGRSVRYILCDLDAFIDQSSITSN